MQYTGRLSRASAERGSPNDETCLCDTLIPIAISWQ